MRREMTLAEARLWYGLLRDFEPRVRRQRPIGGYIADFYCAAAKVVIEVDDDGHFTPDGLAYDAERTAFLEGLGVRVLRFTNAEVLNDLVAVQAQIAAVLRNAGLGDAINLT
jgi:very-short-patch-repair endonuclease